jgi:predicted nucleic acid-binding protein
VNAAFADTFYWIALTNPLDAAYSRTQEFTADIVTTEEVLTEYLNYFAAGSAYLRLKAGLIVETVLQDPTVRLIPQSHESFSDGLTLYRARPDKGYSLTDCISMQTMRRERRTDVLTNDRHFEQEGFNALFRT